MIRLRLKNDWQEAQEFIFQQSQFFEEENKQEERHDKEN